MARPPLELETWGKIRRTTIAGKHTAVAYYRDSDGKTRKMQRNAKTPAAAERALISAMKKRLAPAGGDITADTTITVAGEKWFEEPEQARLAVTTRKRYRSAFAYLIASGFGEVRLSEATVPRVDRFLKRITTENGPSSAKTARTLMDHVCSLAVRHGAIPSNPVKDTASIVTAKAAVEVPTPADMRALRWIMWAYDTTPDKRGAIRNADLADLLDMLIATGARPGEVLALTWADVDFDTTPATVAIHGTVVIGDDGKLTVQDHPKTDSGRRVLTLPAFAADMLTRRRVESYCEWVFPSSTGTLRWPHNLRRQWRDAVDGSPYVKVTPRTIRKAVATRVRDEMGVEAAKEQLGHASSAVTRKHYIQPLAVAPDVSGALAGWLESSE